MCEWGEEDNGRQPYAGKESTKETVMFLASSNPGMTTMTPTPTTSTVHKTGDFVIRIAQGTTVARGDLLMSAGDGTAKPQDDDIVRSKTIAKVTSTTVSTTAQDRNSGSSVLMRLLRGDTINTKKVVLKHNDPCKEFIAVSEFKCIYSSN